MSLETIYYIGQTLAVVAILGSLIALIVQLRQANGLARAQLTFETQAAFSDDIRFIIEDESFAAIYHKAFFTEEKISASELIRFTGWVEKTQMDTERAYFLHRNKLIERAVLNRIESISVWHHQNSPLFRGYWARVKSARFSPEFISHFDDLLEVGTPTGKISMTAHSNLTSDDITQHGNGITESAE